jgi:hypothetical protein
MRPSWDTLTSSGSPAWMFARSATNDGMRIARLLPHFESTVLMIFSDWCVSTL